MTSAELDAIRERHNATTRSNWGFWMDDTDPEKHYLLLGPYSPKTDMPQCEADSRFVFLAHGDIKKLLAEVERLTSERDAAQRTGMDRMQQGIIDLLNDHGAPPELVARIVEMEYP